MTLGKPDGENCQYMFIQRIKGELISELSRGDFCARFCEDKENFVRMMWIL
jgi:hypothetical protein